MIMNDNPIHVTSLFLYPLKISKNLWIPDVFRGYRKRLVTLNKLTENTTYFKQKNKE